MICIQRGVDLQNMRMAQSLAVLKVVQGWFELRQIVAIVAAILFVVAALDRRQERFVEGWFLGDKDRHGGRIALSRAVVQSPAVVQRRHLLANCERE
jgi:hypothetical protein